MKKNIKKKLAIKLVDVLSLNVISEEITMETIRSVFSTVIDEKDIDTVVATYQEYYSLDILMDMISDIYLKRYDEDELIDLINFFSSETGKKWISIYPSIVNEIVEVTEMYGASIADEILKNI